MINIIHSICFNASRRDIFILPVSIATGFRNCVATAGLKLVMMGCIKPLAAHNITGMAIIKTKRSVPFIYILPDHFFYSLAFFCETVLNSKYKSSWCRGSKCGAVGWIISFCCTAGVQNISNIENICIYLDTLPGVSHAKIQEIISFVFNGIDLIEITTRLHAAIQWPTLTLSTIWDNMIIQY